MQDPSYAVPSVNPMAQFNSPMNAQQKMALEQLMMLLGGLAQQQVPPEPMTSPQTQSPLLGGPRG